MKAGSAGAVTPLSFVIVTWNSERDLPALLASLRRHHPEADHEVIVVDTASSDASVQSARRLWPDADIVALDENVGFGRATNIGVRRATNDAVVLLNPDVELLDAGLEMLGGLALETGGLYGPRVLNPDRSVQPSAFAAPASWPLVVRAFIPVVALPRMVQAQCDPWRADTRRSVGWLLGACIVGRRDTLAELGPFDEEIHMYGEDLDLSLRARQQELPVVFAPRDCRLVHFGGQSATQRYEDAGAFEKHRQRAAVVRRRLGVRRSVFDQLTVTIYLLVRAVGKTAARRLTPHDRASIRAQLRLLRELARDA